MNSLWMLELQALSENERSELEQWELVHRSALNVQRKSDQWQIQGPRELINQVIERLHLLNRVRALGVVKNKLPLSTSRPDDASAKQGRFWLIAGPCSAESPEQLMACVQALEKRQISWMRAGIFKPRMSPYDFQGHGPMAIEWIREIKRHHQIGMVSEILDPRDIDSALEVVDMIQIGTRNMHNSALLKEVAGAGRPVLLKRGWSATYQEWLSSAEYLLYHGAKEVLLCERGIRTFETHTRYTLDINAIAVMKELTSLPILIDPSHATGQRRWVMAAAKAAVAAGADGLLVEVHPDPDHALSDAAQSLPLEALDDLVRLTRLRAWLREEQL